MKAQVFYEKEVMRLEDIPKPVINDHEVLIKVRACGVCGSDVSYFFGKTPLDTPSGVGPLILGHEFSGEIDQIGDQVIGLKIGDRVTVNPPLPCNHCNQCKKGNPNLCENIFPLGTAQNGAFAEYVKAPFEHVYLLPDTIEFDEGAIIEPFACATHGLEILSVIPGDFVVIIGAGTIGLMMLKILKYSGAGRIFVLDVSDSSLDSAREFGADKVINPLVQSSKYYIGNVYEWMLAQTQGNLANKVIVPTAATAAFQTAIEISGKKSDIVYFGLPSREMQLPIPVYDLLTNEKTLHFSWLAPLVWPRVMQMFSTRDYALSELITHRYPLEDLEQAIKILAGKQEKIIKAIITF